MKHTWRLTIDRMRLALRNRAFIFFSIVMPMAFLLLFLGVGKKLFGSQSPAATPYLLALVLSLTVMGSFWGLSVQLVMFREHGILRRFRLAPVGAGAMLASSIISNYILTLPTIILQFALARSFFHLEHWGNLWGAWALVTLGTVTFAALGLIVASVTNTIQETQIINNLIWSAFFFMCGASIPLPVLPGVVQKAALYLPPTYLVIGLQQVLLRGASLWEIRAAVLALAGTAAVAFVISMQLFRWEPEEKVPRRAKLWAAAALIPFFLLGAWETANGKLLADARRDLQSIEQHEELLIPRR